MLHGTAASIAGPYKWGKKPDIQIDELGAFDGPKSVVYLDSATNKTMYSLWLAHSVYLSDSLDGPFVKLPNFTYPGSNPAVTHHNGAFYFTNSPCQIIYTTPRLVSGAKWTEWGKIDHTGVPENWSPEDPTLWVSEKVVHFPNVDAISHSHMNATPGRPKGALPYHQSCFRQPRVAELRFLGALHPFL